ncbi:hypothetical protein KY084_05220 [Stakelama sp. CBK3Z-3]|uniref:Tetratricopeptide repeat protein n=1 Tax=Stakelama flava TaxID=2860338 RepID=A0ABS6XLK7_9SPHN|nr:hypothetical protein [Stakelama flava]MBW4330271.1 hypothetical protein [Stakelama flava]
MTNMPSLSLHHAKIIILAVASLWAAWFTATATAGLVFSKDHPELALRLAPGNAEANGNRARDLLATGLPTPNWNDISVYGRKALMRSPANVDAVTVLAAENDAQGHKGLAQLLFKQADHMSRHDTLTQLYLIELAVSKNNIEGALHHYNAALSHSRSVAPLLLPTLVTASADPTIAKPLAELLKKKPIWRMAFARTMVETKADPAASFPILLDSLQLNPANMMERPILSAAISRLIDAGHGKIAYHVYHGFYDSSPALPALIRNGAFENSDGLPPFDWQLLDANGVTGTIQKDGNHNALFVYTEDSAAGLAAEQRLLLQPGEYRLNVQFDTSGDEGGDISVVLRCSVQADALIELRARPHTQTESHSGSFTIPKECADQRIQVIANPVDRFTSQSQVNKITINPAS